MQVDFLRNQSHPLWTSEGKESHQATGSEQLGNQSFSTVILKNLLALQGRQPSAVLSGRIVSGVNHRVCLSSDLKVLGW